MPESSTPTGETTGDESAQEAETTSTETTEENEGQGSTLSPEAIARELQEARAEAARYRTERNSIREQNQELAGRVSAISKALGLETEEPDGADLERRLAERESELRELKIDRALSGIAKKHEADEELTSAVLKSKKVLDGLDPDAEDFGAQLEKAVKAVIDANPKLRVSQVPPKSGSAFNGNGGARSSGPVDLAGALAEHYS